MNTLNVGNLGEKLSVQYMLGKGFDVLETNYHSRYGEVDIIVKNSKHIVFIEVKTRKPNSMSKPAESVTVAKQSKIIKTAMTYLQKTECDLQPRFDVIEVIMSNKQPLQYSINHIENAFMQKEGEDSYASF